MIKTCCIGAIGAVLYVLLLILMTWPIICALSYAHGATAHGTLLYAEIIPEFRHRRCLPYPKVIAASTSTGMVTSRIARVLPCEHAAVVVFIRAVVTRGTSAGLKCVVHRLEFGGGREYDGHDRDY